MKTEFANGFVGIRPFAFGPAAAQRVELTGLASIYSIAAGAVRERPLRAQ